MSFGELRRSFHDDLTHVRQLVDGMATTVICGIGAVTDALLEGDRAAAASVVAADAAIDRAYPVVEAEVFQLVATQAPMARDLRFLIATLRVAMEVERSGDLVASVGRRVSSIDATALTPSVRALLRSMGDGAAAMFTSAAGAYAALDADAAARIPEQDDRMDALHRDLLRELFESRGHVGSVVELGLIARFYERIADHAVVIAERVRFVVDGAMNAGDADERDWS
jgi:phosphate transport system protein